MALPAVAGVTTRIYKPTATPQVFDAGFPAWPTVVGSAPLGDGSDATYATFASTFDELVVALPPVDFSRATSFHVELRVTAVTALAAWDVHLHGPTENPPPADRWLNLIGEGAIGATAWLRTREYGVDTIPAPLRADLEGGSGFLGLEGSNRDATLFEFWLVLTVAPGIPPRRIFPRDDGLTGGAPRTYPPSKGYQSGIRTTGGYL